MIILKKIQKTREYLDYIEEHVTNVIKAWKELQDKCKDMRFMWDDYYYFSIQDEVERHDLSKLSKEEFIQYREYFFSVDDYEKNSADFASAWNHHKENNPHHWENWIELKWGDNPTWEVHCVHMVLDWMAMGYKFGDTAQEYYEKNKEKIELPDWAIEFIYEIFRRVYK